MDKFLTINEASKILGVSKSTLRRWESSGYLKADKRTVGNQRRYKLSSIDPEMIRSNFKNNSNDNKMTIAYARVSSADQKKDLQRQKELLELFCSSNGWKFELISDLGSGLNYYKKGLKRLINLILDNKVSRLVLTHKDRLLRFGSELIFSICESKEVEVLIINKGSDTTTFEEELAKDVLEIITVFSARLYGSRSKKNKNLIEDMKKVVNKNATKNSSCSQNRTKRK
ncbi:MAG: IS607 family transposase [Oligoflexia bacterium]|nr:IS607 family transposase [Oligoflexia bacterium]